MLCMFLSEEQAEGILSVLDLMVLQESKWQLGVGCISTCLPVQTSVITKLAASGQVTITVQGSLAAHPLRENTWQQAVYKRRVFGKLLNIPYIPQGNSV